MFFLLILSFSTFNVYREGCVILFKHFKSILCMEKELELFLNIFEYLLQCYYRYYIYSKN